MVKAVETLEEFQEELQNAGDKLVVVDFYADWCGPCKMIGPKLEALAGVETGVVFLKIDVDENSDTAEECGIQAMPTFQFFKNGNKVAELTGANEDKLKALVAEHK